MTAYRNDVEALRRRLEIAEKRALDAESALDEVHRGRERTWVGDLQLFLARGILMLMPMGILGLLILYFGMAAVFGVFHDSMPLAFIFTAFILPLLIASPIAAYKLDKPSRAGWGLALFSFLFWSFVFPPVGIWGLYAILRNRVRDMVFGEKEGHPRLRVEVPDMPAAVVPEEDVVEEERELSRTNRSGA